MAARADAIVATFALAAERTPRDGKTYDEWVAEVTARFLKAWDAFEGAL